MKTRITIESLKLEGFRAYLTEQTFSLRQGKTPLSLAVFARNAKGKSSLVDAFEFYFSEESTLERLGRRAAQGRAGPIAMEHVDASKAKVTSRVHFQFRSGKDKFEDTRQVSGPTTPLTASAKRILSETKVPFVIRGYELRRFVEGTTPAERYKEFAAWFSLDPLLAVQQNFRSLRSRIKGSVESRSEGEERLWDLSRVTNNALSTWSEPDVIAWFNSDRLELLDSSFEVKELSRQAYGYQELVSRVAAERESIGLTSLNRLSKRIEALFKAPMQLGDGPTGYIVDLDSSVSDYQDASKRESEERSKASHAIFDQVWTSAQKLFGEGDADFTTCPICDTEFSDSPYGSSEDVHAGLHTKLAQLAEYRSAECALTKSKVALDKSVSVLKEGLRVVITDMEDTDYQTTDVINYLERLEAWQTHDDPLKSEATVSALTMLGSSISAAIELIESRQGDRTYTNALKILDDLLRIKVDLQRIERTKNELRKLSDTLGRQAQSINGDIAEYTQGVVEQLRDEVNALYKAIQGGDTDAPRIRLDLPPQDDTDQQRVQLLIDFTDNREAVVPSGYLSDSQLHTLALALRLAAIRLLNRPVPIIVLDDVVTSYDADNRKLIATALANHFNDFQIILVTHDEQFFRLLQDHLSASTWIFRINTQLQDGFGPVFQDHRTSDEVIQAKLDSGESAANDIRQAEEEWLLQICRDFHVEKFAIRPVSQPYRYDRSELASSLASFLKDIGTLPPTIHGVTNSFLESLKSGVVENFGSHFSDDPYSFGSIGDEEIRWDEFKCFRKLFICPKCSRNRFKRPMGLQRPVCRNAKCEAPFEFQSVDPTV